MTLSTPQHWQIAIGNHDGRPAQIQTTIRLLEETQMHAAIEHSSKSPPTQHSQIERATRSLCFMGTPHRMSPHDESEASVGCQGLKLCFSHHHKSVSDHFGAPAAGAPPGPPCFLGLCFSRYWPKNSSGSSGRCLTTSCRGHQSIMTGQN